VSLDWEYPKYPTAWLYSSRFGIAVRDHSRRAASFVAVLKEFGEPQSPSLLVFPRPDLALALNFPNRGEKTKRLLDSFDDVVLSVGGAVHPVKDARMPASMFAVGFPDIEAFRSQMDPKFSSAFWRRIQQWAHIHQVNVGSRHEGPAATADIKAGAE
jgi:hypothetical protein